jgi:hypothetical protein
MYVKPLRQFAVMTCHIASGDSINCGRQFAAPTQNVERHVATKSTSGSVNRRRGGEYKCARVNSGAADAGVATAGGFRCGTLAENFGCALVKPSDPGCGVSPAAGIGGVNAGCSGGTGSNGLDVLMRE